MHEGSLGELFEMHFFLLFYFLRFDLLMAIFSIFGNIFASNPLLILKQSVAKASPSNTPNSFGDLLLYYFIQ